MKVSSRGMLGELVVGCSCVTGSGIVPVTSLCAVVLVERVAVVGWVGSVFTCRRDAVTSTEMLRKGC